MLPRTMMGAVAGLLATAGVASTPLVISPTTVTIEPGRHSAVITIENTGDEPVDLQFRAYDWQQAGGRDLLTPTDALVVSPAIATVAPHAKQLFRVLQTAAPPAPGAGERSYRLRLNELPRPDDKSVAVLLEFSLPVFQGQPGAQPRLQWSMVPGAITVTNSGERRTRITRLELGGAIGASVPIAGAASTYLLSGASRTWKLAPDAAVPPGARLVGISDTGIIDFGAGSAPSSALAAR